MAKNKRSLIPVICIALITSFVGAKIFTPTVSGKPTTTQETTFDRVMRTGTIRCGYAIAKEYIVKDEATGKLSGPAIDIIEKMAKNLDLKIEWAGEIGFATMAQDLKVGRYDMVCFPITANAARSKAVYFSRAIAGLSTLVWVHKDDSHVGDDFSWLNDPSITIAATDGTAFGPLAMRHFPKAKILSMPEMSPLTDQLMMVATKKADATLMVAMSGDVFAQQNDNAIKPAGMKPILINPSQFPLPQGDENFRNMIDTALGELLFTGAIDAILNTYEKRPPQYYWRVPKLLDAPYLSE